MKALTSAVVVGMALAATNATAQSQSQNQGAYGAEVPAAPYFAALTGLANQDRRLPALNYWGVGTAVWGLPRTQVNREPMLASNQSCQIAGRTCSVAMQYDQDQKLETVS